MGVRGQKTVGRQRPSISTLALLSHVQLWTGTPTVCAADISELESPLIPASIGKGNWNRP